MIIYPRRPAKGLAVGVTLCVLVIYDVTWKIIIKFICLFMTELIIQKKTLILSRKLNLGLKN